MKEIRLGIIGYGRIAKTHIEAIHELNRIQNDYRVVLHSCLSRNPDKVDRDIFQVVTKNKLDFFKDEDLMVVDICTPNMNHLDEIQLAHQHKKLIYCEKPLTTSLLTADFIKDLPVHQVALVNRFNPAFIQMKSALKQNAIGDLIHFKTSIYHDSYLTPDRPISWRQNFRNSGGGASMDLGIHSFDLIRFIVGEPVSIASFMKTAFVERYEDERREQKVFNDTDEYMAMICTMEKDEIGIVESSRVSKAVVDYPQFEAYGTEGSLTVMNDELIYYNAKTKQVEPLTIEMTPFLEMVQSLWSKTDKDSFVKIHMISLHSLFEKMIKGISYNEIPTFIEAYRSQVIVDRALRSAKHQNVLKV